MAPNHGSIGWDGKSNLKTIGSLTDPEEDIAILKIRIVFLRRKVRKKYVAMFVTIVTVIHNAFKDL